MRVALGAVAGRILHASGAIRPRFEVTVTHPEEPGAFRLPENASYGTPLTSVYPIFELGSDFR